MTVATRRLACACLLVPALLLAAAGCGGKPAKKKAKKTASGAAERVVIEEKLPAINADSKLTVDEGRLAVSSPQGWARGSRSKEYLVRYTPTAQKAHPSITITAADPPAGFTDVTAANHADFVQAIAAGLAETFAGEALVKQPAAVTIGRHLGVAYAAGGRGKVGSVEEAIDRSFLGLVVNGRLVTVEARAPKGKLDDTGRLAAKAVAAAVSGPPPAAEPEQQTPPGVEQPPTDEPAAGTEKPAAPDA